MIVLRAERCFEGHFAITAIKAIASRHPGPIDLMVHVGNSRLRLGPAWRTDGSPACMAALAEFGEVLTC